MCQSIYPGRAQDRTARAQTPRVRRAVRSGMRSLRGLALVVFAVPLLAQPPVKPDGVRTYKRVGADSLVVHVFPPKSNAASRAAIVLFHGGGFVWGGPEVTDG